MSLAGFNTETRPAVTRPDSLLAPESEIARSVLGLFQSIPARSRGVTAPAHGPALYRPAAAVE